MCTTPRKIELEKIATFFNLNLCQTWSRASVASHQISNALLRKYLMTCIPIHFRNPFSPDATAKIKTLSDALDNNNKRHTSPRDVFSLYNLKAKKCFLLFAFLYTLSNSTLMATVEVNLSFLPLEIF